MVLFLLDPMEPRLSQHQSQKFLLSPQIRQYLHLLRLPITDLEQAVQNELATNPLLEEPERNQSEILSQDKGSLEASSTTPEELEFDQTISNLAKIDEYFDNYVPSDMAHQTSSETQEKRNFQENSLTSQENIAHYLLKQTSFLDLDTQEQNIANSIIGNLDERGYLNDDLDLIAENHQTANSKAEYVLRKVQTLEPPGIAARNLQECLKIQLERANLTKDLAYTIISEYFELLQKRDFKGLAKILNTSIAMIERAREKILRLDPCPGRAFDSNHSETIIPDAIVSIDENNPKKLKIEILHESIPKLRISRYYRTLIRKASTDADTKSFLRKKMQAATGFLKALDLRKSTLHEITEELTKAQKDFFYKGLKYMKPLRLKDISEKLDIHESTVSRALSGKYLETPQDIIPYKQFFSSRIETSDGDGESQQSILETIKEMIEKENPKKPLSDQVIVEKLANEGIKIARRTVAKYRDLLKILPSHLRKKR